MHRVRIWRRGLPVRDVVLGDELSIGRHPDNSLTLWDEEISGRHAKLVVEDDQCFLVDLGSRHGSRIDGVRVDPEVPHQLLEGVRVALGSFSVEYTPDHHEVDLSELGEFVAGGRSLERDAALRLIGRLPGSRFPRLERALAWVALMACLGAMTVYVLHQVGAIAHA